MTKKKNQSITKYDVKNLCPYPSHMIRPLFCNFCPKFCIVKEQDGK